MMHLSRNSTKVFQVKRLDKKATVIPFDGGFSVELNDKKIKTPAGADLKVPTQFLAAAIATEYLKGEEKTASKVQPVQPLLRLCYTAIDRLPKARPDVINLMLSYAATDLLCYRIKEPETLRHRQHKIWQPLLDWATKTHDVLLTVTTEISPIKQPASSLTSLRNHLESLNNFHLITLSFVTTSTGSLIIALALLANRIDATEAFDISEVDATFQIERWCEDKETHIRRNALRQDLKIAKHFLDLLVA